MKVVALVENTRLPHRKDLGAEPGLALCIYLPGQQILFDTGISRIFHSNAQHLNVDLSRVTLAVISHHHFDHGGGLATFLEANDQARIYLRSFTTEQLYLHFFGFLRRRIGLDESLFQQYPDRFAFINQLSEIAPDVFILTDIKKRHPLPKGNRRLFIHTGQSMKLDDFEHELILVVKEENGIVVFSGCSHHGILNMLDAVVERFPNQPIRAVFGGFHHMDLPLFNTMAGSPEEVEELGQALLKYSIGKIYTCHCTGMKAYRILKEVIGDTLEYFSTGCQAEI